MGVELEDLVVVLVGEGKFPARPAQRHLVLAGTHVVNPQPVNHRQHGARLSRLLGQRDRRAQQLRHLG